MTRDASQLLKFAGEIADGTAVDWAQAEAGVDTPELQDAIRQLRIVAGVAAVHRTVADLRAETSEPAMPRFRGHLELRSEIGKGSFGTVYVAWDSALEREVALKLLRRSNLPGNMLREARMLARVRHPNVVTVYGANEHAGALGVWMERIAGASLTQYLSTHGQLSAREAAMTGIDLCGALAAVHRAGLLHRDIKAQNVMRRNRRPHRADGLRRWRDARRRPPSPARWPAHRSIWRPRSSGRRSRPASPATSTASACCCITSSR